MSSSAQSKSSSPVLRPPTSAPAPPPFEGCQGFTSIQREGQERHLPRSRLKYQRPRLLGVFSGAQFEFRLPVSDEKIRCLFITIFRKTRQIELRFSFFIPNVLVRFLKSSGERTPSLRRGTMPDENSALISG